MYIRKVAIFFWIIFKRDDLIEGFEENRVH